MPRSIGSVLVAAAAATVLTSCSGGDSSSTVQITATDTTCSVSRANAKAGKIIFEVHNKGTVVTEAYLYAANDRPVGEVENVEPGQKATFSVKTGGGKYQVACKPNQEGDGIRAAFTITGPPDKNVPKYDPATARDLKTLTVNVALADDVFAKGLDKLVPVEGQVIAFHITNSSTTQPHAFAIAGPDGAVLGDTGPIAPGGSKDLSVTFETPGKYSGFDSIGENKQNGLTVDFKVVE